MKTLKPLVVVACTKRNTVTRRPGCSSLASTSSTIDWLPPLGSDIALDAAISYIDVCRPTSANIGAYQCDEHVRSSETLDHELPLPDQAFKLRRHLREYVDGRVLSVPGPDLRRTRVMDDSLVILNPSTSREIVIPREDGGMFRGLDHTSSERTN
jgi:hypothetical protein